MNILVLHGPNMNLIGVRSAQVGDRVTLDKIDTALRRKAHELEITLKTLQTHHPGKAITFIQRNRNWADGLLFTPGPWAKGQYDILDTLKLVSLPTVEIHFTSDFDPDSYAKSSLFSVMAVATKEAHPIQAYTSALVELHSHINTGSS
ncbi:MAG: type II 3-dehydroquinate dehydratase [Candidatus Neomarinimicrobiota bacterium]